MEDSLTSTDCLQLVSGAVMEQLTLSSGTSAVVERKPSIS